MFSQFACTQETHLQFFHLGWYYLLEKLPYLPVREKWISQQFHHKCGVKTTVKSKVGVWILFPPTPPLGLFSNTQIWPGIRLLFFMMMWELFDELGKVGCLSWMLYVQCVWFYLKVFQSRPTNIHQSAWIGTPENAIVLWIIPIALNVQNLQRENEW